MKYIVSAVGKIEHNNHIWGYIVTLIKGLEKEKKDLPHFLLHKKQGKPQFLNENGWGYSYLNIMWSIPSFGKMFWVLLLWPLLMIYSTFRLMKLKIKKDIHSLIALSLYDMLVMTIPARIVGYKVIWVDNGSFIKDNKRGIITYLYKFLARRVCIITPTQYLQNELHTSGIPDKNISVLYPVDSVTKVKEVQTPKRFTLSAVVSLDYESGIHMILKALELLKEFIPDVELLIIGKGAERNALLWVIRRMGLEQTVRIINESEHIHEWVNQSHLYIVPEKSYLDAYKGIIAAMKCKKLIIAPRVNGLEELVLHKKSGFVIEPHNTEVLAQIILNIYNNQEWLESMGQEGHEHVYKTCDYSKTINTLHSLLS